MCVCTQLPSLVWLSEIPWTIAHQAPLSMEFPRQEYWSGLPFPTPRDLSNPGIQPVSLRSSELAGGFFTTSATWEAYILSIHNIYSSVTPQKSEGGKPNLTLWFFFQEMKIFLYKLAYLTSFSGHESLSWRKTKYSDWIRYLVVNILSYIWISLCVLQPKWILPTSEYSLKSTLP